MECSCGGALIEGKSCYSVSRDNFYLMLEDIPAFQCTRCGRVLFTEETVDRIKKIENRLARDAAQVITGRPSVNLYDY
ncbi:MAG: YgiT-type zinc finger protein [Spirochaetes bacterium]|jgi:YgiT-type zinc finger domain-containing protein|nr:YgiT-type zinc finger protein [Spirochaetota bacterium]